YNSSCPAASSCRYFSRLALARSGTTVLPSSLNSLICARPGSKHGDHSPPRRSVAEGNPQGACGPRQAAGGRHRLQPADGLGHLDGADLRPLPGDHLSERACRDQFHRLGPEDGAKHTVKWGWAAAALEMAEHTNAGFLAGAFLDLGGDEV